MYLKKNSKKKRKIKSLTQLKASLDRVFKLYIRHRDCGENGFVKCITCGKRIQLYVDCPTCGYDDEGILYCLDQDTISGKSRNGAIHAGHFVKSVKLCMRFNEKNVNGQCNTCNTFKGGLDWEYGQALDKKYGPGTAVELKSLAWINTKYTHSDYEVMIDIYKKKLRVEMDRLGV